MKRKWVRRIAVVAVLGCFAVLISFIPRVTVHSQEPSEPESLDAFKMEYTLISESEYDPAYYYANYGLIKDSPITDYRFIYGNEQFEELAEQGGFLKPASLDCDESYCVVTYGREIVDLRPETMNGSYHVPGLTFDETYQGNQVFIYQMDRIPYLYAFNWPCYIMQGEERVYLGDSFFDRNVIDPEGKTK